MFRSVLLGTTALLPLLTSGCVTLALFFPQPQIRLEELACGDEVGRTYPYTGADGRKSVVAEVVNNGQCELRVAKVDEAGNEIRHTTVAPGVLAMIRLPGRETFGIKLACPTGEGPCNGVLKFIHERKRTSSDSVRGFTHLEFYDGPTVPPPTGSTPPMDCDDPPRFLDRKFVNWGTATTLEVEVENTGTTGVTGPTLACPNFHLLASDGSTSLQDRPSPSILSDPRGGTKPSRLPEFRVPANQEVSFSVQCDGAEAGRCQGNVSIKLRSR